MQQLIQISAVRHEAVACLIQIQDMTATIRRERRLRVQSTQLLDATYRDALTGVGNRRRFDQVFPELFQKAQQAGSSLGLIMIDVDFFKHYNDFYGHQAGDQCLRKIAQAIQLGLRHDAGDQVCRYGGEEFAVLLPNADQATTRTVAERLRQRVEALQIDHEAVGAGTHVSISLGVVAWAPTDIKTSHLLITGADLALYHAKEAGRNRTLVYDMDSHEVQD
jgi:diguanylate cyclase (GGDEF)-like protein